MPTKYTYHIDLNERGYFMAHVENSRGRTIVSYDLPEIDGECLDCGETEEHCNCESPSIHYTEDWDIFSDWVGYVKNFEDVEGLERYYKEMGMMPKNARLVMGD